MAAPESPRPARRSRRLLAIALGVLGLVVAARATLPELLRRVIESQASKALGRKVEVADVDLGLLTGRVRVEGLAVGGPDLAAPIDASRALVRLESLAAQIAWLPLVSGKIHLREFALGAPALRLERNPDGSLAPFVLAASEPAPEPEGESKGIDLAIDRLSLDSAQLALVGLPDEAPIGELRFENLTIADVSVEQGVFGIGEVSLRGPDLQVQSERLAARAPATPPVAAPPPSAAPEPSLEPAKNPVAASATSKHHVKNLDIESGRFIWRLPNGDDVETELEIHAKDLGVGSETFPLRVELRTDQATHALEGDVAVEPLRFDGSYRWEGMRIERLALLAGGLPVKITAGRSDGALKIALRLHAAADAPPGLRLEGEVRISDLDLASSDDALAVKWKDLSLALAELTLPLGDAPGVPRAHLTKLALQEPQLDFTLRPSNAEAAAAPPPEPDAAASAERQAPPPQVLVDALELTDGALRFRDTTVSPPVDTALRDLRIRAQGVRWPERDIAKLLLTAKGQQGSTLEIKGSVKGGAGGVDVALRQLPLATFDPYAARASGLEIRQGRLSLDSKLSLGSDRMGAKNKVLLHRLSVGERESGRFQEAFGVPLDVAIALLQDLQGDITLPVDVEQGAGGTQVGIAAAVTAALRQALVGALEAPLKLLGSVAGKAGSAFSSGLDPIPMEPGQGELGLDGHERVEALASLLASRPGLQVALVGRADPSDDPLLARREVLARAKAGESLAGEGELGFFERRRVRSALADADPEQPDSLDAESAAALERLATHVQIGDETRQELARARAQSVAQALRETQGVASGSVSAVETGVGAPGVAIELRASNQ